eukprot:snap_masked-scaffold_7-processed-gene-11.28-mRNA-1 protein AED:1.00 eAED:1.00 QI:0/-1/0/0/-1/1/1/0/111
MTKANPITISNYDAQVVDHELSRIYLLKSAPAMLKEKAFNRDEREFPKLFPEQSKDMCPKKISKVDLTVKIKMEKLIPVLDPYEIRLCKQIVWKDDLGYKEETSKHFLRIE